MIIKVTYNGRDFLYKKFRLFKGIDDVAYFKDEDTESKEKQSY